MTLTGHLRHGKRLLDICRALQNSQLRVKHDNLKVIGIGRQMPIPLNNGATRAALPDLSYVSGLLNLKIQDDRFHAHTVA